MFTASVFPASVNNVEGNTSSDSVYFKRYNVSIYVNEDGSITVFEEIHVIFTGKIYHSGSREIPYYGFEDIVDVKIFEIIDNNVTEYVVGEKEPGTYYVFKNMDDVLIKWWFTYPYNYSSEPSTSSPKTVEKIFIIKYRALAAVNVDFPGKNNYIDWNCLPEEHPLIKSSNITIYIPKAFESSKLEIKPEPHKITIQKNMTILNYHVENIDSDETFRVYIAFPKFINPPFAPRKIINKYSFLLSIIGITASIFVPLAWWYRKYMESSSEEIPDIGIAATPPTQVDPAEIYVLDNFRKSRWLLLTILLNLASKKLIAFKAVNNTLHILPHRYSERSLEKGKLTAWEQEVLKEIDIDGVQLKNLIKTFTKGQKSKKMYQSIVKSLLEKKLIPENPSKQRTKALLKFLPLPLITLPMICASVIFRLAGLFLPSTIFTSVTTLFGLASYRYTNIERTPEGVRVLAHAKAYARYLRDKCEQKLEEITDKKKIIKFLNESFAENFAWLIATETFTALDLLSTVNEKLKEKWTHDHEVVFWSPYWYFYETPTTTETPLENLKTILSKSFLETIETTSLMESESFGTTDWSEGGGGGSIDFE